MSKQEFAPLLASPADMANLPGRTWGSFKLDGIRAISRKGRMVSRKLIDLPNADLQARFGINKFNGFDGEFIYGSPTAPDVYRQTNSVVMAQKKPAENLTFWVFDYVHEQWIDKPYVERYEMLKEIIGKLPKDAPVRLLPQTHLKTREMIDEFEESAVSQGYEGIMLRDANGRYKQGRSTAKEGILLKVKRFDDSEAIIMRIEEEMANNNEALKDNLGRTKRSTAKDGKVGKGTMGALVVRDLKTHVEFNIGTGFTAADRAAEWKIGEIVKYKYFAVGVKDKPRHPVFVGRRDARDM